MLFATLLAAGVAFGASSAAGAVVYFEDFAGDGSGTLSGVSPDIDNNGGANVWEGGANFKNDGTLSDPFADAGAYLPFVPTDGNVYTLEVNVPTSTETPDSNGWIGLGFRGTNAASNHASGNSYAWYLLRDRAGPDNDQVSLLGPNAASFIGEDAVDATQPIDAKIVLDTTAGAGSWTAEYFLNGVSRRLATLPASATGITHVGISFDELPGAATVTTLGSVGSFQLSSALGAIIRVNRTTGEVFLENDGATSLDIRGYTIASEQGALDSDNWLPISGSRDFSGDKTFDSNDDWTKLTTLPSSTDLSEFEFYGDGATLAPGQSLLLSQGDGAWIPWFDEQDLQAQVLLADESGTLLQANVVYEGNGGAPLLRSDFDHDGDIDPNDWATLRDNSLVDLSSLSTVQAYVRGDVNRDGANDIEDFAAFQSDYDAANGVNAFAKMLAGAPEPSSGVCLVLLVSAAAVVRRRSHVASRLCVAAALPLALSATPCLAIGPYSADANTVHLYHFDQVFGATASPNSGSAGNSVIAFDGAPMVNPATIDNGVLTALGNPGFGGAANIYATDKGLGFDGNGDDLLQTDPTDTDYIPVSSFAGATGAFTLELMVNLRDGLGFSQHREFMGIDKSGAGRGVTFRLTSDDTLRFSSITDFAELDPTYVETPVPTTGPHAFETNTWFHVAYAFDGEGTGSFYWTRADSDATEANLVSTVSHDDITGSLEGPLVFGNEGRITSTFGLSGLLDEVRISNTARAAGEYIFANPSGPAFVARVNEATGEVTLVNATAGPLTFSSYQLASSSPDAFLPANWDSLSDKSGINPLISPVDGDDPGSTPGDSLGESWSEVGGAGPGGLAEQFLLAGSTLPAGESVSLGEIYNTATNRDFDFTFYNRETKQIIPGLVEFFSAEGLPGDFNADGVVDSIDYAVWRENLGGDESALNGNGSGNGSVGQEDFTLWLSRFGDSVSEPSLPTAAPEPGCLVLLAAIVAGCLALRHRGWAHLKVAAVAPVVCLILLCQASTQAAVTPERQYSMGDYFDGSQFEGQTNSNGPDGFPVQSSFAGPNVDVIDSQSENGFADLGQSGSPVYHAITAGDVAAGHPGEGLNPSPGTDYGIRFDGLDDILTTSLTIDAIGAETPMSQGVQFWAKPSAAGLASGNRQSLVTDTNNFGGPAITTTGMWTMTSGAHANDDDITSAMPVVADQWVHVAMHAYLAGDAGRPAGGGDWTSVLYVNGVAAAANADSNVDSPAGQFSVGGDDIGGSAGNFFNGVIDELIAYTSGPSAFSLLADNAYIAQAIDDSYVAAGKASGTPYNPGDINLDGDIDDDDVDAFLAGWLKQKRLVGANGDLFVGDLQTLGWGDLDLDGQVTLRDAFVLHQALAPSGGFDFSLLVGGSGIPEPGTLSLLTLAVFALPGRSRRPARTSRCAGQ